VNWQTKCIISKVLEEIITLIKGEFEMRSKILFALVAISLSMPTLFCVKSVAAENTDTKIKNEAGDLSTGTKKVARKGAQKMRKATGNDNVINDAKDKGNDVKDDVSNDVDKAKRNSEPK
jgi:hypothetical protein